MVAIRLFPAPIYVLFIYAELTFIFRYSSFEFTIVIILLFVIFFGTGTYIAIRNRKDDSFVEHATALLLYDAYVAIGDVIKSDSRKNKTFAFDKLYILASPKSNRGKKESKEC